MRRSHAGKLRDWFLSDAKWSVAVLDAVSDVEQLVFLDSPWTRREGLVVQDGSQDCRILRRVGQNAVKCAYFTSPGAERHRAYHQALKTGHLRLRGECRIALRSLEPDERAANQSGTFYLLDGAGRCLPLVVLLDANEIAYEPVEAFVVERMAA
jgi:hypothetical protein